MEWGLMKWFYLLAENSLMQNRVFHPTGKSRGMNGEIVCLCELISTPGLRRWLGLQVCLKENATSFLPGQTTSFASLLDGEIEVLLAVLPILVRLGMWALLINGILHPFAFCLYYPSALSNIHIPLLKLKIQVRNGGTGKLKLLLTL